MTTRRPDLFVPPHGLRKMDQQAPKWNVIGVRLSGSNSAQRAFRARSLRMPYRSGRRMSETAYLCRRRRRPGYFRRARGRQSCSATLSAHNRIWEQWLELAGEGGFDPGSLQEVDIAKGFGVAFRKGWSVGRLTSLSTVLANTCRFVKNSEAPVNANYLVTSIKRAAKVKAPARLKPRDRS